ncbi:MAG: hypothetical protein CFE46_10920 [Burkholderiales bacterium PBB6]|nr:MAG: hypothetical protein CFE46_10920 [Burkholderiales bacterium PBB6]
MRLTGSLSPAGPCALLVLLVGLANSSPAWAFSSGSASLRLCDSPSRLGAPEQDRLLRFAGRIKAELAASGQALALIARSGTDLRRVGLRYSHAGLALRDSAASPWAVRQLYYACEEGAPRLFDQGLPGFVMGADNPALGHVSVLLLPPGAAADLAQSALDKPTALSVLHPAYSANAYAFSTTFQNCNQWVAELMAVSWGRLSVPASSEAAPAAVATNLATTRAAAQAWLQAAGYVPTPVQVRWRPVVWLAPLVPYVHNSDHPEADLAAAVYRVSMPDALEAFARAQHPGAQRLEFCHDGRQIVLRRDGAPLPDDCSAGEGDTVWPLD